MEIGNRIRRLRLQRGLTQEELADRCELSKGFISLLERDLTSPSIATLVDVLESLGTDLKTFFGESGDEKLVFGEKDVSVKEDAEGLRGCIRWLVPSAQKNRMEPILLELGPGGETDEDLSLIHIYLVRAEGFAQMPDVDDAVHAQTSLRVSSTTWMLARLSDCEP